MITRIQYEEAIRQATQLFSETGITLRANELANMEVADFGLGELSQIGAQIVTLVDTDQVAAKLIALLPHQILPEHRHPPLDDYAGKAEAVRCEWGECYVNIPGKPTATPLSSPPAHRADRFTVHHEHILQPGEQMTLEPNTPHWFQGGPQGAVIWSISTKATDIQDIFTDPDVSRMTTIAED